MNEYYIGNTFFTIMVMAIMMAIVSGNRYMAKETKRGLIFTFKYNACDNRRAYWGVGRWQIGRNSNSSLYSEGC